MPSVNRVPATNDEATPRTLLPPRWLQMFVGAPSAKKFKEDGAEVLDHLIELCDLQPDHAVLDVGCGSGRMALPLTGYLNAEGRYAGFDVSRRAVAWCTKNISRSRPNFEFKVADIYNGLYNRKGKSTPAEFRFPFPDASFDVVFLASVFTHMFPSGVENYLREIARVLKPGGRCLITFFLLNEESLGLINAKKQKLFKHAGQGYRTNTRIRPEVAVAYEEPVVRNLYERSGLSVVDPVRYGSWCGRTEYLSFQDIVVAVKPPS